MFEAVQIQSSLEYIHTLHLCEVEGGSCSRGAGEGSEQAGYVNESKTQSLSEEDSKSGKRVEVI